MKVNDIITESGSIDSLRKNWSWDNLIHDTGIVNRQEKQLSREQLLGVIKQSIQKKSSVTDTLDVNAVVHLLSQLSDEELGSAYTYIRHYYSLYPIDRVLLQQVAKQNMSFESKL